MSPIRDPASELGEPTPDASTSRREFVRNGLAAGAALATARIDVTPRGTAARARPTAVADFELDEVTVAQLQQRMTSGEYTSRRLTEMYLGRIREIDGPGAVALRAVIEVNPDAVVAAEALDAERATRDRVDHSTEFRC
ncbi:MAG: hypothetical protein U0163_18560 [Gemmatimonadaceae bacterium]